MGSPAGRRRSCSCIRSGGTCAALAWLLAAAVVAGNGAVLLTAGQEEEEAARCGSSDSCCFSRAPLVERAPGGGTAEAPGAEELLRYVAPSWMRACLEGVRTGAGAAERAGRAVEEAFRDSYAGARLLGSAEPHVGSPAPGGASFGASLNSSAARDVLGLDVPAAVEEALRASTTTTTATARLDGDLDGPSAFGLHYGLAAALRPLMDANTFYLTPFGDWALHRQVTLRPAAEAQQGGGGAPEWRLRALAPPRALTDEQYAAVHGAPPASAAGYEGAVVTHVNGVPAAQYMQARADRAGGSRDPGVRLARLLAADSLQQREPESLAGVPPPEADAEEFRFAGGGSATWRLTARHRGAAARDELPALYGGKEEQGGSLAVAAAAAEAAGEALWGPGTPAGACSAENCSQGVADRLEGWAAALEEMAKHLLPEDGGGDNDDYGSGGGGDDYGSGSYDDDYWGSAGDEGLLYYCDYGECDYSEEAYDYDDFTDTAPRALADDAEQLALLSAGAPRASGGGFLGVYHLPLNEAVAVKVSSFQPAGGFYGPRLGRDAAGAGAGAEGRVLSGLALALRTAEGFARERGLSRLLVDLSGAGGSGEEEEEAEGDAGYAAALYALRSLRPEWRAAAGGLCEPAALPLSNASLALATAAGAAEDALQQVLAELGGLAGERLRAAGRAVARAGAAAARLGSAGARVPAERAAGAPAAAALAAALEDPAAPDGAVLDAVAAVVEAEVAAAARVLVEDALGGRGKRSAREPHEALSGAAWLDVDEPGPQAAAGFSPLFFPAACQRALDHPLPTSKSSSGKEAPPFEEIVVLVDGVCGAACSTVAARLALSGAAATVSYGGGGQAALDVAPSARGGPQRWREHAWARATAPLLLRALAGANSTANSSSASLLDSLPEPLPASARMQFTVEATFDPDLSNDALPREFYRIPAQNHLPIWVESPATLPTEGESLDVLRAWRMALQYFSSATPPSPSEQTREPEGGNNKDAPRPIAAPDRSDLAAAVSVLVELQGMDMAGAEISSDSVSEAFSAAPGVAEGAEVVVVSFKDIPDGVLWNVTVVFPQSDDADSFSASLQSGLLGALQAHDNLRSFPPELKGSLRTQVASAEAYRAAVEADRSSGLNVPPVESSSRATSKSAMHGCTDFVTHLVYLSLLCIYPFL